MISSLVPLVAAVLSLSSTAQAAPAQDPNPHCHATSAWPGWSGVKHAFIFGDSYTTTGFNVSGTQPTPTNPLGNPTYPGYTASNGPNWVDFLTVKYNASTLLTYDLAYGGATIDSALVAPYLPTVSSVAEQIQNEWFPAYGADSPKASWSSDDSLFAIFDGINDVGNSYLKNSTALNNGIFAVYRSLVDELYQAGARNFAFLNVPPVDRSPLTTANSVADQTLERNDIADWNNALKKMAESLKDDYRDVNVFTIDTNKIFTQVLNKPSSYPQTALYKNTTAYCVAYENGTPTTDYFNSTCGIPVNQYFWLNSLHPTYPMHDVLAQQVSLQLEAGPNVC
ncbi:carbohydrate esterase family 16 protein [Hyaloscypha hepaticicola]|uniref:Carbohydrate esterase family 16 protein n=1 Tax=Hyaloscypha hepaticicola TaxID=2082293 RepID=A0A2J6Q9A2_9HELO|nr:carbohydrate esterase family 16 protein [Hyaloscypha hepaticicola]